MAVTTNGSEPFAAIEIKRSDVPRPCLWPRRPDESLNSGNPGREVDFLVTLNKKPALLVEAKLSDTDIPRHGLRFTEQLGVPYVQVVGRSGLHRAEGKTLLVSADRFLSVIS
jgi:hypothetical protein